MAEKRSAVLERPYHAPIIDNKTIEEILSHPKFFRGHVRTSTGKLYTTEEFAERSDRILGEKMP